MTLRAEPMRRFRIVEPTSATDPTAVVTVVTAAEVEAAYFPYWRARMIALGRADKATLDNCIEDWITVNWAEELFDDAAS